MRYIDDPDKIQQQADKILDQLPVEGFPSPLRPICKAMVQSCADQGILENIRISAACIRRLQEPILHKSIFCDVEMVRCGIQKKFVQGPIHCYINEKQVMETATQLQKTRSMLAVDRWTDKLNHQVAVVGNAPTALFRLIEHIKHLHLTPHLIIACPVGFIGAADAKRQMWQLAQDRGLACITLLGPRGGSAIAIAALHSFARLAATPC